MSAGAFEIGRYESTDTGNLHPIRVQPETKALQLEGVTNAYPTETDTVLPSAQVSRGKRALGINARTVTIRLTAALTGYKVDSPITLPWFVDGADFNGFKRGDTGTYLGTACVVVGTSKEKTN